MFNPIPKAAFAVIFLISCSYVSADRMVPTEVPGINMQSSPPEEPLADPVKPETKNTDPANKHADETTLRRLDELRLLYLRDQYRNANERAFAWYQAIQHESQNQGRPDVLLGLWRRHAEAYQTVRTIEDRFLELDPAIFTGDRSNEVEPMPFGAGSFGPWSTGLPPARP
jgi:hypothetical protein